MLTDGGELNGVNMSIRDIINNEDAFNPSSQHERLNDFLSDFPLKLSEYSRYELLNMINIGLSLIPYEAAILQSVTNIQKYYSTSKSKLSCDDCQSLILRVYDCDSSWEHFIKLVRVNQLNTKSIDPSNYSYR